MISRHAGGGRGAVLAAALFMVSVLNSPRDGSLLGSYHPGGLNWAKADVILSDFFQFGGSGGKGGESNSGDDDDKAEDPNDGSTSNENEESDDQEPSSEGESGSPAVLSEAGGREVSGADDGDPKGHEDRNDNGKKKDAIEPSPGANRGASRDGTRRNDVGGPSSSGSKVDQARKNKSQPLPKPLGEFRPGMPPPKPPSKPTSRQANDGQPRGGKRKGGLPANLPPKALEFPWLTSLFAMQPENTPPVVNQPAPQGDESPSGFDGAVSRIFDRRMLLPPLFPGALKEVNEHIDREKLNNMDSLRDRHQILYRLTHPGPYMKIPEYFKELREVADHLRGEYHRIKELHRQRRRGIPVSSEDLTLKPFVKNPVGVSPSNEGLSSDLTETELQQRQATVNGWLDIQNRYRFLLKRRLGSPQATYSTAPVKDDGMEVADSYVTGLGFDGPLVDPKGDSNEDPTVTAATTTHP